MGNAILLDFGSTFTKATVVDLEARKVIMAEKEPSSVGVDAKIALDRLYDKIRKEIGEDAFRQARKLATSSAAGGLRMVVIGLTPTLSITAGKNAAFGAGAKILKAYSGELTEADVKEIESMNVEIILLCGGYEGGNTTAVMHNVDMLGTMDSRIPIIYAGNSEILKDVKIAFYLKRKECFVVNNIIPKVGEVDAEHAVSLIRNIFLERITNMKGLDKVKSEIERIVMPTPAAVLEAGELLSRGCGGSPGLGDLMIVDIGGATTDIHTYCESKPFEGAKIVGSPEPYARRTVEGDLGMRESSGLVIAEIGDGRAAADLNISTEQLKKSIKRRLDNIEFLAAEDPQTEELELRVDQQIARYACRVAVRRHSGRLEHVQSRVCGLIQRGKNLTRIRTVIGTGGPIIHSGNAADILREAVGTPQDEKLNYMLPREAEFFEDADYVLYAAGILKEIDPEAALAIMKNSLKKV